MVRYEVGTMMPLLGSSGAVAPWASPSSAGKLSFRRQRRPCSVSLQLVTARGRLPGTCRRMRLCVPAAGHCAGAAPGDIPPDEASCCCTGTAGCSRSRCSRNARTLSRQAAAQRFRSAASASHCAVFRSLRISFHASFCLGRQSITVYTIVGGITTGRQRGAVWGQSGYG